MLAAVPERKVPRADPVKEAALAAKLRDIGRIPRKSRRYGTTCSTASVSLPIRSNDFSLLVTGFPRLNQDQVWVACRPYAVLIILKLAEHFRQHM